jgi:hypothetical protein
MQVLRAIEPIEIIGPAPQHGIEEGELLLQRAPIVSPDRLSDLVPNALHGSRTGKAITELPAAILAGRLAHQPYSEEVKAPRGFHHSGLLYRERQPETG